jgi:hypothetical protein
VAGLALLPVALLTTTGSAAAATNSLTVATYDRTGAKVSAALTVVNVSTYQEYKGTGNKTRWVLPKGTYAIVGDIWTSRDHSDTLECPHGDRLGDHQDHTRRPVGEAADGQP